jgi:Nitrate/nitrite transporter
MLIALAGLDTHHVGYVVGAGGVLGAIMMLVAGNYADRHGDRFLNAFWLNVVMAGALVALAIAPSPIVVIGAYLTFAATCFTIPMLVSSGWSEVLHIRELAVGAAAINSLCSLGGFAMPFAWGAARDATGSFAAGLSALVVFVLASAALTMRVRAGVRERRSAAVLPVALAT